MTESRADHRNVPITVGDTTVLPGRTSRFELPFARLPTGSVASLPVAVVNGRYAGPHVWLSAAIHGDEIAGVEPGADALPPPTAAGTAPAGTVTVEIVNGSPERLEILYTGPQTGSMTIDPCGDCVTSSSIDNILLGSYCGTTSSPRRTITLAPGDYQVVAKAADGADVRPFSGTWALASGTAYSDCYYIQQSPF